MTIILADLRHAARSLRRSFGFAAVATGTLVLGIGVTVAMFSVLQGVLLQPLPFANPERIVRLWESNPAKGHDRFDVLPGSFLDWREQTTTFEALALYRTETSLVTHGSETERLRTAIASPSLLTILGVTPVLGRGFLPEQGRLEEDGRPELLISHALWRRKFGGDPAAIGKTLTVGGWASLTIVGVMPPAFDFPEGVDLWGEEILTRAMGRGDRWRSAIGKLKQGASIDRARAELQTIASRSQIAHPRTNAGWSVVIAPLADVMIGGTRSGLLALFGAVLALLLIACANVASAVLARGTARRHELAVRMALGASRWRIVRLSLTEGLLIAGIAGALGLLLADTLLEFLLSRAPAGIPRLDEIGISQPVLIFAIAVSLLTVLVFGVAAWVQPKSTAVGEQLKSGPGRSSAPGRARAGAMLVAAQIAISMLLLVGAGLLLDTFVRLTRLDLGFDGSNVWTTELAVPMGKFSPREGLGVGRRPEWHRLARFYPDALERVQALPGIESAALVNVPALASETPDFFRHGRTFASGTHAERWPAVTHIITSDYFRVLRIPVQRGRAFTNDDRAEARLAGLGPAAPGVAIVNQAMARRYWPGRDPIGEDIALEGDSTVQYRTIVGVVGDTLRSRLEREPEPIVYVPFAQKPTFEMTLLARAGSNFGPPAERLRVALRSFESSLSVPAPEPLERVLASAMATHRFGMLLVSVFGVLALLLTAVGLYGVIAFIVSQRTREIGIRVALGARPADVVRLVFGYAAVPVVGGVLLGLIAGVSAARVLAALIAGARAAEPLVFVSAGLLVLMAAGLALMGPVRDATAVDPIDVLRTE